MRQLKINKSIVAAPNKRSSELKFTSDEERLSYFVSQFKEKTGLKEGAKVRYIGANDEQLEYWNNKYSDPRGILDLETIYEIESIVIGRSYTIVKLIGFKEEEFNGVIFEAVDKVFEKVID